MSFHEAVCFFEAVGTVWSTVLRHSPNKTFPEAEFDLAEGRNPSLLLQVFCEAKRTSPSILYIPHLQQWWDTAGPALRASFFSLLDSIPSFSPILLLATCNVPPAELDPEVSGSEGQTGEKQRATIRLVF